MLESTQREDWKRKHFLRFFIEERLIDLGTILLFFGNLLCGAVDFGMAFAKKMKKFAVVYKIYSAVILGVLFILFSMFW